MSLNVWELWEWMATVGIMSVVILYIQYKLNRQRMEALAAKLPGPKTLPIIGNLFFFLGVSHEGFIQKIAQLGRIYEEFGLARFWLGPQLVIGIYKPFILEAVLSNAKVTNKSYLFSFYEPRTTGSFAVSGEAWKKQRRMANRMFHPNLMERYMKIFNEQSFELIQDIYKKNGQTFEVSHPIMQCTLDTICRSGFGVEMHIQHEETFTFAEDLSVSSEIIIERMYKPWLYPEMIFKLTSTGKKMFKKVDKLHQFTKLVLDKRREVLKNADSKIEENGNVRGSFDGSNKTFIEESNVEPAPYLDVMLDYAKYEKITDKQLVPEILDIIIGGADTSAIADSYILVLLGIYKDWQEKIHKELDDIFGDSNRDVTMVDCLQLVQMEMVIKEVLRLYTAPHSLRLLTEDVKLEKFTLPAGATVYLAMFLLHRDPLYWKDPENFNPEHFLPEQVAARPKFSYLPFSHGPRGCPGSRYGMLSMKVVLANILRKFRVECDLKFEEMKYKPSLMLELVGGYHVRLIPRVAVK